VTLPSRFEMGRYLMAEILKFIDLTRHFERDNYLLQASGVLAEGSVLAVRGPSGSGKSTLLKMLARLLAPNGGGMLYRGQDYSSISPLEWRRRIQYLSQKPVIFGGTVEQNLKMPFSLSMISRDVFFDWVRADEYMQALGLSAEMLSQEAQTLSGGEAARVALIRALLIDPEVLLLDEPTAYLDENSRKRMIAVLRNWLQSQPFRAIIIVSHQPGDILELPGLMFLDLAASSAGGNLI